MDIKVSIIIPLYNAEKFIGECLDSILSQTFPDYEVIITDDCSTDNSLEFVKSYIPKFGDRLTIAKTNNNSGNAAMPRNIGIELSHGEYLLFVDSDDALTPTALEELYITAKKLDADILCCRRFYIGRRFYVGKIKKRRNKKLRIRGPEKNIIEILKNPIHVFASGKLYSMPWAYFFRREMIVKNHIHFPSVPISEDKFFVFSALFFAEKSFLVPIDYYYYRKHAESITTSRKSPQDEYRRNIRTAFKLLKALEDFTKEKEFFRKNLDLKYGVYYRFFFDLITKRIKIFKLDEKISLQERTEIIYEELEQIADNNIATFIFCKLLDSQKKYANQISELKKMKEENILLQEENKILKEKLKSVET